MTDIPKRYDASIVEKKWYDFWIKKVFFHSEPDYNKKPVTIVIPPPNITGNLHMGHALNNVLQDVIIRIKRLQGFNTCWIPGTDHGGIATQNVVEKEIYKKEKITRKDLGREEFLKRMWDWRKKTGSTILYQLRKLGCTCDWQRERFTMDEVCSKAVRTAFKKFFDEGLIYRGERMINWCPRCETALSDIEVEYEEENSHLWYIKYPLKNEESEFIVVATTRPETMLGDTAVAVNPSDKRYKELIGKYLILPLVGRKIPVIADERVDMEFGTGAVKVTPYHDPVDYEISIAHNLPKIKVIDEKGNMTEEVPEKYRKKDRFKCRELVVEDLKDNGYLEKTEDYTHSVGTCYRCHTVIEPLISLQWFMDMGKLKSLAIDKIEKENLPEFYPSDWKKPYKLWLENLKDWCLSRQIWWGHRIPVWYCKEMKNEKCKEKNGIVVSLENVERCPYCGSQELIQDEDVLDTWFSSALWPFSVFGWPEENKDLNYYYPTYVLVTGYEILYLWVARMVMTGLYFRDKVPFYNVLIHGIVRDKKGKKMSKSLGNVIDPLDIIEKYGADVLRAAIIYNASLGRDVELGDENFIFARNFLNKVWNASKFIFMNLDGFKEENIDYSNLPDVCIWILSEFNDFLDAANRYIENFDLANYFRSFYEFFWYKFCDWFLELSKFHINGKEANIFKNVFVGLLKNLMIVLHPVAPHFTEEIYSYLKNFVELEESILLSKWPKKCPVRYAKKVSSVISIIESLRTLKSELGMQNIYVDIGVKGGDLGEFARYIEKLAKVGSIKYLQDKEEPEDSIAWISGNYELFIFLKGKKDVEFYRKKLDKEVEKLSFELEKINRTLSRKEFIKKAKKEVIDKMNDKKVYFETKLNKFKKILENF